MAGGPGLDQPPRPSPGGGRGGRRPGAAGARGRTGPSPGDPPRRRPRRRPEPAAGPPGARRPPQPQPAAPCPAPRCRPGGGPGAGRRPGGPGSGPEGGGPGPLHRPGPSGVPGQRSSSAANGCSSCRSGSSSAGPCWNRRRRSPGSRCTGPAPEPGGEGPAEGARRGPCARNGGGSRTSCAAIWRRPARGWTSGRPGCWPWPPGWRPSTAACSSCAARSITSGPAPRPATPPWSTAIDPLDEALDQIERLLDAGAT